MVPRAADEREQRRGLILGLSLAEVLLLLLFLLLLLLVSQVRHFKAKAESALEAKTSLEASLEGLKPLQLALILGGAPDIANVQLLVAKFQNLQKVEQELAVLKAENVQLAQQSELFKSLSLASDDNRRAMADAAKRAAEIDPNDPPAILKRALDVLDKLGPSTRPDQVKPLSQMVAGAEADRKITELTAERDKLALEKANLMRSGNGLTYPSCWMTAAGQTEYIFDVMLTDGGVRVKNATPARVNDPAWAMVASFARDSEIKESTFISSTKPLFEWSKRQQCRFYTIIRDATGPTNKARYKKLRQMVEGNFYPYIAEPQRLPAPESPAPPPPPVSNGFTQFFTGSDGSAPPAH
ncbi:hypothetical protein NML43_20455 [Rhodopseudomonas palustris]|uniref:hypothetical protein n=1 Tax=Rhodopseudomonas palustris TaxID=1076 RepID=UPI0020CEF730|nr:hypothetical protein [Rhodopseudomonas palustris]MCP9629469.1 hypothetical protein [Rhodopseudomonas palustris]